MRIVGIILIVIGILMFVFHGVNFQTEKKVVDAGNMQINKKETNRVNWPYYAGGVVVIVGIVLVVVDGKKRVSAFVGLPIFIFF